MNILVTGANGFVGKNLISSLEAIRDGKDRTYPIYELKGSEDLHIFSYNAESSIDELEVYCQAANFVFHLAGVNRPKDPKDFMKGNFGFSALLLDTLKKYNNTCPIMLASSVQATLQGRFARSEYGASKLAGEKLFHQYSVETRAKIFIYRFPNLFGKWCRPNYNSVVATFCHNIANNLPFEVNDKSIKLDLVYIDDVIKELLDAINGKEHRDINDYCYVPEIHRVTLDEVVNLLLEFKESREKRTIPDMTAGSFSKKLYATYLSYLSSEDFSYSLMKHEDDRGSFTEILHTIDRGQFSVNISKPGIVKGQHWHHTKNEKFVVVSGTGRIQLRRIGVNEENGKPYPVIEYSVSGEDMTVVEMIPGYTHNIINTSSTEDLVTFMWCNECFDSEHPDTFFEEV